MKVKYKGSYIVDSSDTTKKLLTKGKYCEDDIEIEAEGGTGGVEEVSDPAVMDANLTVENNGKLYKYIGQNTEIYKNGDYYRVSHSFDEIEVFNNTSQQTYYPFEIDEELTQLVAQDQQKYGKVYKSTNPLTGSTNYSVVTAKVRPGDTVTLWINSYAYSTYNYTVATVLDSSSVAPLYSNVNTAVHTRSFQKNPRNGLNETNWRKYTYTVPNDGRLHFLYVSFYKSRETSSGDNAGRFLFERVETLRYDHFEKDGSAFGLTTKEMFYSFPESNLFPTNDGAYVDFGSYELKTSSSFTFSGTFRFANIKSFVGPVECVDGEYNMRNTFANNMALQYFMFNFGEYSGTAGYGIIKGSYSHYSPCFTASNVRVFVINATHPIKLSGTYHAYICGASAKTNANKIKTIVYNGFYQINSSNCMSYAGGYNPELVSIWMPDLESISSSGSYNSCLVNLMTGNTKCKQTFFPKLKQIGYTSTGSSYGQMKTFYTKETNQAFDFVYFPALETIYCVNATATNGTFASSTGVLRWFFPRLSTLGGTGAKNILNGCSNTTEIHFGKRNQAYIESTDGYSTKWGASSSATIFFDLINDITVGGVTYTRKQENDYMASLTYGGKVYYRDDSLRDENNIKWQFWAWKADDGSVVYTQNTLCLTDEWVWNYVSGEKFDYLELGTITDNDWRYGWTDENGNTIYTTNQWTPAVGDMTYNVSSDGKSFVNNASITEVE